MGVLTLRNARDYFKRYPPDGLLTLGDPTGDVGATKVLYAPDDPSPFNYINDEFAPIKKFRLTRSKELDTMKSEDEPSIGSNGRLRPRKSTDPNLQITKSICEIEKTKKSISLSKDSPNNPGNLATKSGIRVSPCHLCAFCDKKFTTKQNLSKHTRRIHITISKHASLIKCLYCSHTDDYNDIIRHMVDSHPNQYFACLDCHTRFSSTSQLAEHKHIACENFRPSYSTELAQKKSLGRFKKNPNTLKNIEKDQIHKPLAKDFEGNHSFHGIVISCELKSSQNHDTIDIEDNITANVILPPSKKLSNIAEKNAVIVLDDIQWNKKISSSFSFHNTDADHILSRLGVVQRAPRTGEPPKREWYKAVDDSQKFEKCFDTSFYSKVASNVQENLSKFLDGSFNFKPDPENIIITRKLKNSVAINTVEGFPILLACEQYTRNTFDNYLPRAIAPKHKWKWENLDDRNVLNSDQIKRDSHTNKCIITLVSSLDIWTQLCMRRKFEDKYNPFPVEKKTEKQNIIGNELKEILESREIPTSSHLIKHSNKAVQNNNALVFPASLGLVPSSPTYTLRPAVLSGEWVRPRCYVCCACGAKMHDSRGLSAHISTVHPNAQVQYYEIAGDMVLDDDIVKHLYVPPNQIFNRTRPMRGLRECTKCKSTISLEDLHQHMLDCAGDTPTVRRKVRPRPFGVRRRRPRLPDNIIRKKLRKAMRSKQSKQKRHARPRARTEVGDAETIRKMIADLPAKRQRVLVNPVNPMIRPRKILRKQRGKLLIKRCPEDLLNRKLRSNNKNGTETTSLLPMCNKNDKGKQLSNCQNSKSVHLGLRVSRTVNKNQNLDEKKKISTKNLEANGELKSKPMELVTGSDTSVSVNVISENDLNRIDVQVASYKTRNHSDNKGSSSHDGNNPDRQQSNSNQPNRNTNEGCPSQNVPLKHSIARLTANTETYDKGLQFQNIMSHQERVTSNMHSPTGQQLLFENEAVVSRLDKPPLHYPDTLRENNQTLQYQRIISDQESLPHFHDDLIENGQTFKYQLGLAQNKLTVPYENFRVLLDERNPLRYEKGYLREIQPLHFTSLIEKSKSDNYQPSINNNKQPHFYTSSLLNESHISNYQHNLSDGSQVSYLKFNNQSSFLNEKHASEHTSVTRETQKSDMISTSSGDKYYNTYSTDLQNVVPSLNESQNLLFVNNAKLQMLNEKCDIAVASVDNCRNILMNDRDTYNSLSDVFVQSQAEDDIHKINKSTEDSSQIKYRDYVMKHQNDVETRNLLLNSNQNHLELAKKEVTDQQSDKQMYVQTQANFLDIPSLQRSKPNKPRKGLNDCIAMLQKKLVEPNTVSTEVTPTKISATSIDSVDSSHYVQDSNTQINYSPSHKNNLNYESTSSVTLCSKINSNIKIKHVSVQCGTDNETFTSDNDKNSPTKYVSEFQPPSENNNSNSKKIKELTKKTNTKQNVKTVKAKRKKKVTKKEKNDHVLDKTRDMQISALKYDDQCLQGESDNICLLTSNKFMTSGSKISEISANTKPVESRNHKKLLNSSGTIPEQLVEVTQKAVTRNQRIAKVKGQEKTSKHFESLAKDESLERKTLKRKSARVNKKALPQTAELQDINTLSKEPLKLKPKDTTETVRNNHIISKHKITVQDFQTSYDKGPTALSHSDLEFKAPVSNSDKRVQDTNVDPNDSFLKLDMFQNKSIPPKDTQIETNFDFSKLSVYQMQFLSIPPAHCSTVLSEPLDLSLKTANLNISPNSNTLVQKPFTPNNCGYFETLDLSNKSLEQLQSKDQLIIDLRIKHSTSEAPNENLTLQQHTRTSLPRSSSRSDIPADLSLRNKSYLPPSIFIGVEDEKSHSTDVSVEESINNSSVTIISDLPTDLSVSNKETKETLISKCQDVITENKDTFIGQPFKTLQITSEKMSSQILPQNHDCDALEHPSKQSNLSSTEIVPSESQKRIEPTMMSPVSYKDLSSESNVPKLSPCSQQKISQDLSNINIVLNNNPVSNLQNHLLTTTVTTIESTTPVYTLNTCISVTKLDLPKPSNLTNTLLSVPGNTITKTTSVYTLAGTTVGTSLNYGAIASPDSSVLPDTLTSAVVLTESDSETSLFCKSSKTIEVQNSYENSIMNDAQDPEIAKKMAMLPKELLDILGTIPKDHQKQLLNVLPQYVSTSPSTSATQIETDNQSDTQDITLKETSITKQKDEFEKENKLSNLSTDTEHPLLENKTTDESTCIETTTLPITFEREKKAIDLNDEKLVPVNKEEPENKEEKEKELEVLDDSSKSTSKDSSDMDKTVKILNQKTSSLRAVRIKSSSQKQKSTSSKVLKVPDEKQEQEIDFISYSLAIQQAEVTSTQHNNRCKTVDSCDINYNSKASQPVIPSDKLSHESSVVKDSLQDIVNKTKKTDSTFEEQAQDVAEKSIVKEIESDITNQELNNDEEKTVTRFTVNDDLEEVDETKTSVLESSMSVDFNKCYSKVDNDDDSEDDLSLAVIVKQKQAKKSKSRNKKSNMKQSLNFIKSRKIMQKKEKILIDDKKSDDYMAINKEESKICENFSEKSINIINTKDCYLKNGVNIVAEESNLFYEKKIPKNSDEIIEYDVNTPENNAIPLNNEVNNIIDEKVITKKSNETLEQICVKNVVSEETHSSELLDTNQLIPFPKIAKKQNLLNDTDQKQGILGNFNTSQKNKRLKKKKRVAKFASGKKYRPLRKNQKTPTEMFVNSVTLDSISSPNKVKISCTQGKDPYEFNDFNECQDSFEIKKDIYMESGPDSQLKPKTLTPQNETIFKNEDVLGEIIVSDQQTGLNLLHSRRKSFKMEKYHTDIFMDTNIAKNSSTLSTVEPAIENTDKDENKVLSIKTQTNIEEVITKKIFDKIIDKNSVLIQEDINNKEIPTIALKLDQECLKKIKYKSLKKFKSKEKTKKNNVSEDNNKKIINVEHYSLRPKECIDSSAQNTELVKSSSKENKNKNGSEIQQIDIVSEETSKSNNEDNIYTTNNIPEELVCDKLPVMKEINDLELYESVGVAKEKKSKHKRNRKNIKPDNVSMISKTITSKTETEYTDKTTESIKLQLKSVAVDTINTDIGKQILGNQLKQNNHNIIFQEEKNIEIEQKGSDSSDVTKHFENTTFKEKISAEEFDGYQSDSNESSKSDVPLKVYFDQKEKKILKLTEKEVQHKKYITGRNKNTKIQSQCNEKLQSETKSDKTLNAIEEELRSEQFMKSFGFFSERKPRKSNLLATKKISETFHIIENEKEDSCYNFKEKVQKKHQNDSTKTEVRRGKKKSKSNKIIPSYCNICEKEFSRADNYLRHQTTLLHVSKLSEIKMKIKTALVPEEPNYLIAYQQHLGKLKLLTDKLNKKKKNSKSTPKIKMPTVEEILAEVSKTVREQQLAQRGLSRDEALFIDCCELLKESHMNEMQSIDTSHTTNVNKLICSQISPIEFNIIQKDIEDEKCDSKSDGDVDSITAKNILESEEVRNLENDLISGLKEAANVNSLNTISLRYNVSNPLNNPEPTVEDKQLHSRQTEQELGEDLVQSKKHQEYKEPEYKEKMYPDLTIDDLDMFEDKFDKIKRKCRSQAAAAKHTSVCEPSPSHKVRSKKPDKKKGKKSKRSSAVLTKGALKGFDGVKVSIPTSDINTVTRMSAYEPPAKKRKRSNNKNKVLKKASDSLNKHDNNQRVKDYNLSQTDVDVYEFMDNEDIELFEFRPSTLMERIKSISNKDVPGTSNDNHGKNEADNLSASASDGDDFVYMSDDYVCSDNETENSLMSLEHAKINDLKKNILPLRRKDTIEKNTVMGKIFKNNALRNDKKTTKSREVAKPKANLDQLFDSLLEDEPNSSALNENTFSSSIKSDLLDSTYEEVSLGKYDSIPSPISSDALSDLPIKSDSKDVSSPVTNLATSKNKYAMSKVRRRLHSLSCDMDIETDFEISTSKMYMSPTKECIKFDRNISSPNYNHFPKRKYETLPLSSEQVIKKLTPKNKVKNVSLPRSFGDESGTECQYSGDLLDQDSSIDDTGVARQRARRKCTVGKQNILAETWSSESEPDGTPVRVNSMESVLGSSRRRKGRKREGCPSGRRGNRHFSFKKQDNQGREISGNIGSRKSFNSGVGCSRFGNWPLGKMTHSESTNDEKVYTSKVTPLFNSISSEGIASTCNGSKARPRSSAYYNWSLDGDDEQEHIQQHGWIVGDSHKKLVTMLAHAKGRKRRHDEKRHFIE